MKRLLVAATAPLLLVLGTPPASATTGDLGHDVSRSQCSSTLPAGDALALVDVNSGRPFEVNPCLQSEVDWAAATPDAMLYVNTANPAPTSSHYWPQSGASDPALCRDARARTDPGCAYDYGWHAAGAALAAADALSQGPAWARARVWWLDVEDGSSGNSWNGDTWSNTADLQGMADRLRAAGVSDVGVYSLPDMWTRITGGYRRTTAASYRGHWGFVPSYPLEDGPVWYAGLNDVSDAAARCATPGLTLGESLLAQYSDSATALDGDRRCADRDLEPPSATLRALSPVTTASTAALSWVGDDAGTGVGSYDLRRQSAPYAGTFTAPAVVATRLLGTSLTVSRPARGTTGCWGVRARDVAGNLSPWTSWTPSTCTTAPLDDLDLTKSAGWTRSTGSSWYNGSYTSSSRLGSTLTKTGVQASHVQLLAYACPTCGKVTVVLGGTAWRTVDLRSSTSGRRWFDVPRFSLRTTSVQLRVASSGRVVRVDALLTSRL